MAPKLYFLAASPPCRAAYMVAKAIGLEVELQVLEMEQLKSDEILELNPQHTVPILVDADEDFTIWDSHAIAGYLVGQYAEDDSMYPKEDIKKRALIDQRLHFENGVLFVRLRGAFIPLMLGDEVPEDAKDSILEALGFLEAFLDGRQWFAGDDITIADLSLLATIVSIEALVFPVDPDRFPKLAEWLGRAKELPYYEECNSEGLEKIKAMVAQDET